MEYSRVECTLKCWCTVFYRVFPVWTRFARHSANTWNGDTKLGTWESSYTGLSDPQNSMSQHALVAELLLLEHFTGKSVKNRFAQQGVRILSMVIKLGVRESSTLWLSHAPIRLWIVARVAELLLLEHRHFTGKRGVTLKKMDWVFTWTGFLPALVITSLDRCRTGNSKEENGHTLFPKPARLNCVFGTILYQICMIPAKS